MIIKLKNIEILNIYETVYRKGGIFDPSREEKINFPISIIWKVKKNMKKLEELTKQYQEEYQTIFNSFKTVPFVVKKTNEDGSVEEVPKLDENGQPMVRIADKDIPEFLTKINELRGIDNEIDIDMLSDELLAKMDDSIDPRYFNGLDFMI